MEVSYKFNPQSSSISFTDLAQANVRTSEEKIGLALETPPFQTTQLAIAKILVAEIKARTKF